MTIEIHAFLSYRHQFLWPSLGFVPLYLTHLSLLKVQNESSLQDTHQGLPKIAGWFYTSGECFLANI
jgi:hypothetical protein